MTENRAIYEEAFRVRSFETDTCNRWKAHHLQAVLQEVAKNHAEMLDCGYEQMYERGLGWVLARLRIRFLKMPGMGQVVRVRTWPKGFQQKVFFLRDFSLDCEGELGAQVTSAWLIMDLKARRLLPIERLELQIPLNPVDALSGDLEKIGLPDGLADAGSVTAGYSAVDAVGHVNSARYFEWIEDIVLADGSQRLKEVAIQYSGEVGLGATCLLQAGQAEGRWWLGGTELSSGRRAFEAVVDLEDIQA